MDRERGDTHEETGVERRGATDGEMDQTGKRAGSSGRRVGWRGQVYKVIGGIIHCPGDKSIYSDVRANRAVVTVPLVTKGTARSGGLF